MSSLFESTVYSEERRNPWARISLMDFMKYIASLEENEISLSVRYRHNVSTGYWFTVKWTWDGRQFETAAQTLDKALWRAAVRQLKNEERLCRGGGAMAPEYEI